jgi:TolB-like protein/tetratricopeptide (TPR) repeat protein
MVEDRYDVAADSPARQTQPAKAAADTRILVSIGGFANINGGPSFDALATGLQQELIRSLSEDREITIRSGLGEAVQPPPPGAQFGARFRLSGSLQRVGTGMRIDAKLVEVATGDHLWVERYEGEPSAEFQRVVVGLIASQVRVNLMLGKFSLRDQAPADGPEVRQIVNSAIVSFFRQTPESLAEAMTLAERALAIDPGSMRARRTLSAAISASISLGELPSTPENLDRALALAQEVVQAVPHDEIARCELAWALSNLGRHGEAAEHLRQAVDFNPASPNARADLAEQLAILGRAREALEQVRLAFATSGSDPLEIWRYTTVAMAHFALGEYREALEATRHMVEAEPRFARGALLWAASAAGLGRDAEARRAAAHLLAITPQFRLAEISPIYLARYVEPEHQARLLEMLGRAGLA